MLFTEPIFVAFFIAVLALHWLVLKTNHRRKVMLLVASYVFYAAWDPRFLSLIIISTLVDHVAATRIAASDDDGKRRRWLLLSLVVNLGMLGVFKYAGFFVDSFQDLADSLGFGVSETTLNITLPVGISFFTFQTLSYTIDVYRGTLEPRKSLLDVAVFVAFFPQLVAGPIVRAAHFLPQLEARRELRDVAWRVALPLFFVGYFKKAVLGDTIGAEIDGFWGGPRSFRRTVHDHRRVRLRRADLPGLLRLLRHGHRGGDDARLLPGRQLRLPVLLAEHRRVLAAVAHQPVVVAA